MKHYLLGYKKMGLNSSMNKAITILTIIFIWLDVIFTAMFIKKFGIEIEANVVGRFLFQHPILLILVKILSSLVLVWIYKQDTIYAKVCLWIIFVAYTILIIYHIILSVKVGVILLKGRIKS